MWAGSGVPSATACTSAECSDAHLWIAYPHSAARGAPVIAYLHTGKDASYSPKPVTNPTHCY